ncbi:MAG: cell division protein SepF [Nanoarchaeota archaeon]|nr:cell division protein SepF [Nanoarchaeota archaeon]
MFFFKKKKEPIEEFVDMKEVVKDKLTVRFFKLSVEADVDAVKSAIADGKTIVMLNVGYFANKEQLKKCLAEVKKTAQTFDGDIVALNPGLLLITPKSIDIEGRDNQNNGGTVQ